MGAEAGVSLAALAAVGIVVLYWDDLKKGIWAPNTSQPGESWTAKEEEKENRSARGKPPIGKVTYSVRLNDPINRAIFNVAMSQSEYYIISMYEPPRTSSYDPVRQDLSIERELMKAPIKDLEYTTDSSGLGWISGITFLNITNYEGITPMQKAYLEAGRNTDQEEYTLVVTFYNSLNQRSMRLTLSHPLKMNEGGVAGTDSSWRELLFTGSIDPNSITPYKIGQKGVQEKQLDYTINFDIHSGSNVYTRAYNERYPVKRKLKELIDASDIFGIGNSTRQWGLHPFSTYMERYVGKGWENDYDDYWVEKGYDNSRRDDSHLKNISMTTVIDQNGLERVSALVFHDILRTFDTALPHHHNTNFHKHNAAMADPESHLEYFSKLAQERSYLSNGVGIPSEPSANFVPSENLTLRLSRNDGDEFLNLPTGSNRRITNTSGNVRNIVFNVWNIQTHLGDDLYTP